MFRIAPVLRAVRVALIGGFVLVTCLLWTGPAAAHEASKKVVMIETKDSFQSGNKTINVLKFEPSCGGKQRPVVVMLHGQDGWGQILAYRYAAEGLVQAGHVVLLIRYYDRTDTKERLPINQLNSIARWLKGDAAKNERNEARDHFDEWIETVADAVAYARTLPNVDRQRVGLVGFSLGGYLALSAAPQCNPPVGAVVEMFGGLPTEKRKNLGPMPPTLIVHGADDDVVPVDEAYKAFGFLWARKPTAELLILNKTGHACCYPGTALPNPVKLNQARDAMTEFFQTQMSDGAVGKWAWEGFQSLTTCAADRACPPARYMFPRIVPTGVPSYRFK
jgi:dienelactone hydrolase